MSVKVLTVEITIRDERAKVHWSSMEEGNHAKGTFEGPAPAGRNLVENILDGLAPWTKERE